MTLVKRLYAALVFAWICNICLLYTVYDNNKTIASDKEDLSAMSYNTWPEIQGHGSMTDFTKGQPYFRIECGAPLFFNDIPTAFLHKLDPSDQYFNAQCGSATVVYERRIASTIKMFTGSELLTLQNGVVK